MLVCYLTSPLLNNFGVVIRVVDAAVGWRN